MEQKSSRMSPRKKVVLIVFCVLLVVLLLCTFFSRSIYNLLLPKVETAEVSYDYFVRTMSCTGTINFPKAIKIKAGTDGTIGIFPSYAGNRVAVDNVLCTIVSEEAESQALESQRLSVLSAQNNVHALENQLTSLKEQLEVAELKYQKSIQEYPYNGKLTIDRHGYLHKTNYRVGDTVKSGQVLCTMRYFVKDAMDEEQNISAPFDLTITYITTASSVDSGDTVIGFTAPAIDVYREEQQLSIDSLKRSIQELQSGTNTSKLDEAREKLAQEQKKLADLQSQYGETEVLLPASGSIGSTYFAAGDRVTKDDVLATLITADMVPKVTWEMDYASGQQFNLGDSVAISFFGATVDGTGRTQVTYTSASSRIGSRIFDLEKNVWRFGAEFEFEGRIPEGTTADIQIKSYTADQYNLLPVECLKKVDETKGTFYVLGTRNGFFGPETYVMEQTCTIIAQSNLTVAISDELRVGTKVLRYTSKAVDNNDVVEVVDS